MIVQTRESEKSVGNCAHVNTDESEVSVGNCEQVNTDESLWWQFSLQQAPLGTQSNVHQGIRTHLRLRSYHNISSPDP